MAKASEPEKARRMAPAPMHPDRKVVRAVAFSFMTAGLAAFRYQRRTRLIRTRRLLRWFGVFSLLLALVFFILLVLQYEAGWRPGRLCASGA